MFTSDVKRASLSQSRWAVSGDSQPRCVWLTGAAQTAGAAEPAGTEEGPHSGVQCLGDEASWWECPSGESAGPRLAVGVLPSQHSFQPDAQLSPAGLRPHTVKANQRWLLNQSSGPGNGEIPQVPATLGNTSSP